MLMFSTIAILALVNHDTTANTASTSSPNTHTPSSSSLNVDSTNYNRQRATTAPSILPYLTSTTPSTTNSNLPDSSYWGDSIHCSPKELHRVYFQNLDGLRNDNEEIDLYVESMLQYQVGTFCWTDPCIDFLQTTAKSNIQSHNLAHFKTARTAFSTSTIPNEGNSFYKPGGTLTTTTGKWTTRCIGQPILDSSGMGRWSGLTYLGKNGKRLTILTAYRSPRQQFKGGFGFYDQQHALLLASGIQKPNVRKQFVLDIVQFIQRLQLDGHDIILSLDANELSGGQESDKHGIDYIIQSCHLQDLHTLSHSQPPETYKYGFNRRIDFMLGTESIANSVVHAGYLPFDDNGISSKHRGLFIDFDHHQVMGQVDNITRQANRQLNSEDPIATDLYLAAFKQYVDDHDIYGRLDDLKLVIKSMTLTRVRECYDSIDRDITRAMLHAEKSAKKPSGKYVWSPELRKHGLLTRYWRLRLRNTPHPKQFLSTQIQHLKLRLIQLQITLDDNDSNEEVYLHTKWKSELKNLRTIRQAAYDYRTIHMDRVIRQYQVEASLLSSEDTHELKEIRKKIRRVERIISNEQMRQPFRLIKAATKTSFAGGLSKLYVPTHATNQKAASRFSNVDGTLTRDQLWALARSDKSAVAYETILDCSIMEKTLNEYNRSWFRQAADTPFGHGDLFKLTGFDGLTEEADAIINGECIEYMGIPMSNELKVFLEECKRPKRVTEISAIISDDDFQNTVKKWKEATSTSPSGRHLGHYKAAILDDTVTQLHVDMLNLPIQHGFAPDRWTHSVTPMIEKDEGKPFLTRLRIIHLFEADYNLFLKILFGRRMVSNGERYNALNDQQHGSRPRRMTMDALFLARLEKDLIRQTKTNAAHMDNDATGCYDRIIVSLGMIACRRLGMPSSAIQCQADALLFMRYAVKHVYGISDTEYHSTILEPLFGTGQGSGASPAIWLSLVTVLLNSFDRLALEYNVQGLDFTDPWREINAQWHIGAFVDDTNQGILDLTHSLSPQELTEQLRTAGQLWENLLHISGGALNLSKCNWSLQFWEWRNGRPRLQPVNIYDSPLLMTSGDSPEANIIQRIDNNTAARNLGVYLNANGTFSHHAKFVKAKSDTLAHRLQSSRLSRTLSLVYYRTTFLPSIGYSLPVTSMTDTELQQAQTLMNGVTLNKLGYNRNYPRAAAFAPTQEFGTGIHDIRVEQGLAQIKALLNYIGTGHKVGKVMLISYRTLQIEAGVHFHLLEQPKPSLPYLTPCWFTSLRNFCCLHNIAIQVKDNQVPQISRSHDRCLMDVAAEHPFSKRELLDINLVRMYLKVCTISDITNAAGNYITETVWRCLPFADRTCHLQYPRQLEPTVYQRRIWRKLLRQLLQPQAKLSQLQLSQPLGHWIAPSTMKWKYSLFDGRLYIQNITHTNLSPGERCVSIHFARHSTASNGNDFVMYDVSHPDCFSAQVPKQATPADIEGKNIVTITSALHKWPLVAPEPPTTFQQWRDQLPVAENRLLFFVTFLTADAESLLQQHLIASSFNLYVGTDGGRKEGEGSFAWLICSTDCEPLVCNSGPVDGWSKCQSSYRSELQALSSAMLFLDEYATFHEITVQCSFHIMSDSTGAISAIERSRDKIPSRQYPDHADIVATLDDAEQIISKTVCQHVKSHQDDTKDFSELPFAAQVNVICDRMATRHMDVHRSGAWSSRQNYYATRNQPVVLSYKRQRIPSHYTERLRDSISSDAHRSYLQQRYRWDDFVWSTIAWEPLYSIGRRTRQNPCFTNRSKLIHNWLNLGSQRSKIHLQSSETSKQCPYCRKDENFIHLLTCADPRAKKCRFLATTNLRKALRSFNGGPTLLRLINLWIQQPENPLVVQAPTRALQWAVNRAIASQTRIGWEHLFRGIISSDWGFIASETDSTPPPMRQEMSKTNLICAIQTLQNYTLAIWAGRNEVLHSNTLVSTSIREAHINSEISAMYQIRHTFSAATQQHFRHSIDTLLLAPYRTRQRWLIISKLITAQPPKPGHGQAQLTSYNFSVRHELLLPTTSAANDTMEHPTDPKISHLPMHATLQTQLTTYFHPSIR